MEEQFKLYICIKCRHEVLAMEKPQPIKWTDGHVCYFTLDGSALEFGFQITPERECK